MKKKRGLTDAAKDPLVDKQRPAITSTPQKKKNNTAVSILLSLALGFLGGLLAA
jgi:hypothetical protein